MSEQTELEKAAIEYDQIDDHVSHIDAFFAGVDWLLTRAEANAHQAEIGEWIELSKLRAFCGKK